MQRIASVVGAQCRAGFTADPSSTHPLTELMCLVTGHRALVAHWGTMATPGGVCMEMGRVNLSSQMQ